MARSTKTTASAATRPAARKPAGPKAAKPAPAAALIDGPVEGGVLKAKDLLDRVAARAGANKKQAKTIIDAVLHELGASIARGEGFVLPPLGRAKVTLKDDEEKGPRMIVRLKRGAGKGAKEQKDGATPLAPAED